MEVNISPHKLKQLQLYIATPMYGGMCTAQYLLSMVDLVYTCHALGIKMTVDVLSNESLITRGRNTLAANFLKHEEFSHLIFIDSDIGFRGLDVIKLAALDKDIVCAPYPSKTIAWEKVYRAVKENKVKSPDELSRFAADFVFNLDPHVLEKTGKKTKSGQDEIRIPLNKPFPVKESGTGFMCIKRQTLEKFKEGYPDMTFVPDQQRSKKFDGTSREHIFFDTVKCPDTGRYLSEDYMFCQWARKIGIEVWLCPFMELRHVGSYVFEGNMQRMGQLKHISFNSIDGSQLSKEDIQKLKK